MLQPSTFQDIQITVPILPSLARMFQKKEETYGPGEEVSQHLQVYFSQSAPRELVQRIRYKNFDDPAWIKLSLQGTALRCTSGDEDLLVISHLREYFARCGVVLYPHQMNTVQRVVHQMNGRAILADEVGLGKTIEAGMILKEYILRNEVANALILVPSTLIWQWFFELKDKFNIPVRIQRSSYDWDKGGYLIASLDTAKRPQNKAIICQQHYDMLIVDEAHKLKSEKTQNFQLVNSVVKKYFLLLTATPVQNDLKELYNLINLLRPGQLGTYKDFQRDFTVDKRTAQNTEELQRLIGSVLIRNRRGKDTIELTKRLVSLVPVTLGAEEAKLYQRILDFVRVKSGLSHGNMLPFITLLREACSSPQAAALTIEKMLDGGVGGTACEYLCNLLALALSIEKTAKMHCVLNLIDRLQEKVIIFTEFKATQRALWQHLSKKEVPTLIFNGELSRSQKQWVRSLFKAKAQVLISTESGGEGLNLQFCRNVINYDLPWNPLRIEQRIGRVHRLGQTKDVQIFNLATRNTIEEHILYLLHEKLDLFRTVVGDLDAILSKMQIKGGFETSLGRILLSHTGDDTIRRELDDFATQFSDVTPNTENASNLEKLLGG
ncbi:MAG: DEAD/DEAH box helicase [Limnochordia bacterium]|nr:DEAD/DEAH box helicase [Limnochordia bacterium]